MPPKPDREFNLNMLILALLNFFPHLAEHRLITSLAIFICFGWRFLYEFQKIRLPNLLPKTVLILATFYLIFKHYGTLLGVESATALLIASVALKMIDNVEYRDAMVILFLNFLLLMALFLVSQTLTSTIFASFDLALVTALLFQLHKGKMVKFNLFSLFKTGFRILLQITPLLTLLFFVFPRFSTGFYSMYSPKTATTGFNDFIAPGEVARIVQSEETAFRVHFADVVPKSNDRYWRGAVLSIDKGMRWEKNENALYMQAPAATLVTITSIQQDITLEPHYGKWLFALDSPESVVFREEKKQKGTFLTEEGTFNIRSESNQRLLYEVNSSLKPEGPAEAQSDLAFYLDTHETDPRVLELVKKMQVKNDDEQTIDNILNFYAKNLRYTLNPGNLTGITVGKFLFEKKMGFCEHFAVSFAHLLRLANIPARVVVGFQGGTLNELSDYYMVKDKDAHAWTEYYSRKNERWQRSDPTESVAPLRIQLGGEIYNSVPQDQLQLGLGRNELTELYKSSWYNVFFGRAELYLDVIASRWNSFLLNYDTEGQRHFLEDIGLGLFSPTVLGFISLGLLVGFYIYLRKKNTGLKNRRRRERDLYLQLCKKLEKNGFLRAHHEGPKTFLLRAEKSLANESLREFIEKYQTVYYGSSECSKEQMNELKELLKKCA